MTAAVSKPVPNLLTPEQHDAFDLYVRQWQERLGLQGWRVERSQKKTKNMAEVAVDHKALLATYRVGQFGATVVSAESIESTALHELLHVLLYGLVNQVDIELTGQALEAEEHKVIHTLEKLLMGVKA